MITKLYERPLESRLIAFATGSSGCLAVELLILSPCRPSLCSQRKKSGRLAANEGTAVCRSTARRRLPRRCAVDLSHFDQQNFHYHRGRRRLRAAVSLREACL